MKRFALALVFLLASFNVSAQTPWFVWDATAGAGCTLGQCWENAYTSVGQDWGAIVTPATDIVYIHGSHAESGTGSKTITGSTAESEARVVIFCVVGNTTGTTPGNLTTGCSMTSTSTGIGSVMEGIYIYGLDIIGERTSNIGGGSGENHDIIMEQCSVTITGNNGARSINVGGNGNGAGTKVRLVETDLQFAHTGQDILLGAGFVSWDGGAVTGSIFPVELLTPGARGSNISIDGVDLSLLGAGEHLVAPGAQITSLITARNVEIGSDFDWVNGTLDRPGTRVEVYYTEVGTDANPSVQIHFEDMHGEADHDTARTITVGATSASDGTTDYSWTLDTTTNTLVSALDPFVGPPVSFWLTGDGTSQTVRFHWADTNGFDDDEAGLNCLIGSNPTETSTLGVWVTTRPDPLTAGSANPADTTTWGGTDVTVDFYTDVTASPDKDSLWTCYPWFTVDAERVSFNPLPDLQ